MTEKMTIRERTFRTPLGRIAYHSLISPRKKLNSEDLEYAVTLIFDKARIKDDPETKQQYLAMKALVNKVAAEKFGTNTKNVRTPFKDGDEKGKDILVGQIVIDAKNKSATPIVGPNREPVINSVPGQPDSIYSGCYVYANLTAYAYDTSGNKGVSLQLNGIQKVKDGPVLAGKPSVDQMFDDLGGDDPDNYKPASKATDEELDF
jgi:hypothetical protein